MKKIYKSPKMYVETFTPNEYVAACGDHGKEYYFKCNAQGGTLYYYPQSDGEIDGVYSGRGNAKKLGSYHPCNAQHRASSTDPFYDGFIDYNHNGRHDRGEGVIVWRGRNGRDGHATKNLDMSSWETAKS